jgi:hypothetical protein
MAGLCVWQLHAVLGHQSWDAAVAAQHSSCISICSSIEPRSSTAACMHRLLAMLQLAL